MRKVLRLFGVAYRDFNDVLQDIFLAVHRSLDRYDPTRYARAPPAAGEVDAADPDAFLPHFVGFRERRGWDPLLAWLFGIAWRQVSHYRERAYRRREIPMGLYGNTVFARVDDRPSLEEHVAAEQQAQLIEELLSRLDPQRRVVLVMHDMLGIPVVDVARELGINENTAQNRIRLARNDLRAAVNRLPAEKRALLGLAERTVEATASGPPVKPRGPTRR